jgi:hypothetical protein
MENTSPLSIFLLFLKRVAINLLKTNYKEKKLLCTGTNIKLLLLPGLHIVADTRNGHHSDVSFPHDRTHQHEFALDPPFVKNQINQRYSLVYCFCFWPKK